MNPGQSIFLLPFANDDELAVGILVRFDDFVEGRDFDAVDGDRTVGDVFAGLAFRGSLTPASEKKCHEASKMAYFFVKFYKFVSAISYYM